MTDSTTEEKASDGGVDVGSSAEELFGPIDDDPVESSIDGNEADERELDDDSEHGDADASNGPDVEDQTAASVFGQLKADHDGDGDADDVLADESPEDIIASADDPDPEPEIDEALRADEEELATLLLTDRTKGEEFLWIDTGADGGNDEEAPAGDEVEGVQSSEAENPVETADEVLDLEDDEADDLNDGTEQTPPEAVAGISNEDADATGLEAEADIADSETETDDEELAGADSETETDDTEVSEPDTDATDLEAEPEPDTDRESPVDADDESTAESDVDPADDADSAVEADKVDETDDEETTADETDEDVVITDAPAGAADEPATDAESSPDAGDDEDDSSANTAEDSASRGFLGRKLSKLNPF